MTLQQFAEQLNERIIANRSFPYAWVDRVIEANNWMPMHLDKGAVCTDGEKMVAYTDEVVYAVMAVDETYFK